METVNVLHPTRDTPHVPNLSSIGLYYPERQLDNEEGGHRDQASSPSQCSVENHQHRQPLTNRCNDQSTFEEGSEYSPENEEDDDLVRSDEERMLREPGGKSPP